MEYLSKYELEIAAGWRGAVAAGVGAAAGYVWHKSQSCYVTVPAQIILAIAVGALVGVRETYDVTREMQSGDPKLKGKAKSDYFCSEVGQSMKAWARTTSVFMVAQLLWQGTRALEKQRLAVLEAKAVQTAIATAAALKK